MALRTVPLTRRDFFWEDPFFSNVWEDFDRMRQEIWQESRDFFNRFDRFDKQDEALKKDTESLKSSMLESSRAKKYSKMMEKSTSSKNEISRDFDDFGDFGDFGKFTSRRWLMPRGFFDSEFTNFSELLPRTLLTHQLKDEVLRVKEDENKFEVSVDTHGYKPEELEVKIKDNIVTIEAKHQEKKDEENNKSFVSRHFSRSFTLPQGCKMERVTSNLSADGLLLVTAPKIETISNQPSRKVPIEMKKY